uniref:Reverse transcriptase zinc-binding domain-containing protein n=1 Tax=Triticum urartu TaxID=4572 RepID=A0A8R7R5F4_TRIUA
MKERKWPGDPKCSFCDNIESSRHLFFTYPVAKVVWRCVGMVL